MVLAGPVPEEAPPFATTHERARGFESLPGALASQPPMAVKLPATSWFTARQPGVVAKAALLNWTGLLEGTAYAETEERRARAAVA